MLTEDCPVIDDTGVRSMPPLLLISLSSADPLTMVDLDLDLGQAALYNYTL